MVLRHAQIVMVKNNDDTAVGNSSSSGWFDCSCRPISKAVKAPKSTVDRSTFSLRLHQLVERGDGTNRPIC